VGQLAAPLAALWRYLLKRLARADKAPPEASVVRRAQVSTAKSSGYHLFPFILGRSGSLFFFFFSELKAFYSLSTAASSDLSPGLALAELPSTAKTNPLCRADALVLFFAVSRPLASLTD
jgi:hypothetical protein